MITSTRRRLLAGVCALTLLIAAQDAAKADIPVVDFSNLFEWASSLATQAKQWETQNLQWVEQIKQYETQLQQYQQEVQLFLNFYHYPSLGMALGILMRSGLGNDLPANPYAVLNLVNGLQNIGAGGFGQIQGILGTLSGLASQAFATSHVYTPTDGSWASQQIIARANGIAGAQGAAETAYEDLRAHQAALQPLRDNLLAATDTKGVLDATAQINVETAWNVNAAAQLQAISATYAAQNDSIIQRENEKLALDLHNFLATSPVQNP